MLPTLRVFLAGISRRWMFAVGLIAIQSGFVSAAVINTAEPFLGVTHYQIIEAEDGSTIGGLFNLPRPVVVNIIEIDPTTPGINFLMQPGNGAAPGEVTRTTTRSFVNGSSAQIGLNADFYSSAGSAGGQYYANVTHTGVSNGNGYSSSNVTNESIFNVSSANVASMLTSASAGSFATNQGVTLYNAIGGNQRIVTNGVETAPNDSYTNTLNPHTAMGVTFDGHVLLMTVDGRQNTYSEGMRTDEMADLLISHFNAKDAINVDGGGSTTLVMDDRNDGLQNARVINSPSDGASPQSPGGERLVANNFAVFATPNPAYIPLAQPARPAAPDAQPLLTSLTLFDDFEGSKDHFASAPTASGSSRNVAASSSSTVDTQYAQMGESSLRLDIDNSGASPERLQLRLLSGGASPSNNLHDGDKAMGTGGHVGFFMRAEPGNDPLYISVLLDDGTTVQTELERADFQQVTADGEWHLYEWDLADSSMWNNFSGGNGAIGGPNAFIDAIYLSSAPATSGGTNWSGTVWIDTVAYNPNGDLSSLVPEPGTASVLMFGLLGLYKRSRNISI
jgi:Phosphodiester glycosidase